jgi:DNA-directed RNA polymerase specialized sigma24 family protein
VDRFYRYIKNNFQFQETQIQDILSESYIKIRNSLDRMQSHQNIQSYCRSIVRNCCLDGISKHKEISFSELDQDDELSFEETLADPSNLQDLLEESFQ